MGSSLLPARGKMAAEFCGWLIQLKETSFSAKVVKVLGFSTLNEDLIT
jgi:hypothetical protein